MKKFTFCGFLCALCFIIACGDGLSNDKFSSCVMPKSSSSNKIVDSSSSSVILSSSCIEQNAVDPSTVIAGSLTDSRDGRTYKTVTIGTQTWMAQNLNYETAHSYCYSNTPSNCTKYGRLYTWAAAMDSVGMWTANGKDCGYGKTCSPTLPVRGVCPTGWHLPTQTEWGTLFTAVGVSSTTAGTKLKSTSGWNSSDNSVSGTDNYSFSALPAGGRYGNGDYDGEGDYAYFWSSTEYNSYLEYIMCNFENWGILKKYNSYLAYIVYLDYNDDGAYRDNINKYNGFSVRCVKD